MGVVDASNCSLFADPESIIRFGVGRNMVTAICHWALACNMICEQEGCYWPTALRDFLFGKGGRELFWYDAWNTSAG
jgi:hypothetical protein